MFMIFRVRDENAKVQTLLLRFLLGIHQQTIYLHAFMSGSNTNSA